MNFEKFRPVWDAARQAWSGWLRIVAVVKRGILAVEARVMRVVRWAGGRAYAFFAWLDLKLRPLTPRVSDFILSIERPVSLFLGSTVGRGQSLIARARPHWLRFWTWIRPFRVAICKGIAWLADKVWQFGGLSEKEALVMREAVGSDDRDATWRTRTRVDVGMWYRKGRVWACPLAGELLLFAEGARPWVERIPYTDIRESKYNHVTAEIAFAPSETLTVSTLRLPPLEALALLKHFRRNGNGA